MGDVKDILGLPRQAAEPKEPKVKEPKAERPKGVSREAYNLLYGAHPITPSNLLKEIANEGREKAKTKQQPAPSSAQVTYRFMEFDHQARTDNLKLKHWTRCFKDPSGSIRPAEEGNYPYAQYNRSVMVYRYDDIEFETIIRPTEHVTGWSKEETDYLLDLCERLDLRFIVIADRWDFPGGPRRTVEDLKERYYSVASQLLIARHTSVELVGNNPLIKHKFEAQRERERKEMLRMALTRTQQEEAEEEAVLKEADRIMQQRKAQAEAKRSEGAPLMHAASFSNSTSELPFFNHQVIPIAPPKPGVYLRRQIIDESIKKALAEQPMQLARAQKSLDTVLQDIAKVKAPPGAMTRSVSGMWLALHSEALMLVQMRQRRDKLGLGNTSPVVDDGGRGKRLSKAKTPRYDDPPSSVSGGSTQKRMKK